MMHESKWPIFRSDSLAWNQSGTPQPPRLTPLHASNFERGNPIELIPQPPPRIHTFVFKGKNSVLKFTASALVIAATLGLAACDSKSEQKAQDAQAHQENAQQKMESAQAKVNDAAKENA